MNSNIIFFLILLAQVAYMIVDEMHAEHPELVKDQFWDEVTLQRILPKPNKTYKPKFAGHPRRATLHRGS